MTVTFFRFIFPAFFMFHTASCSSIESRLETRDNLLSTVPYQNEASYFLNGYLPVYYQTIKTTNRAKATIYIEGDGFAYISPSRASNNPSPKSPLALKLAVADSVTQHNVFYMARPCQYITGYPFHSRCLQKYWTTHRYGDEVIESMSGALESIKAKFNVVSFDLVGFSGGGNIAGILSAKRDDIDTITTVAGNLDNDYFTRYHNVSDMPHSLNMADYAIQLSNTPQKHFIAEKDIYVPPQISASYAQKLAHLNCATFTDVKNTSHHDGWAEKWPTLVKYDTTCIDNKRAKAKPP